MKVQVELFEIAANDYGIWDKDVEVAVLFGEQSKEKSFFSVELLKDGEFYDKSLIDGTQMDESTAFQTLVDLCEAFGLTYQDAESVWEGV